MVEQRDDEEQNILEQMLFSDTNFNDENEPLMANNGGSQILPPRQGAKDSAAAQKKRDVEKDVSSEEESDEDSEEECDPNGDVAQCEACQKFLPFSKLEKHISYFCKKQVGECPFCYEKFPLTVMDDHMKLCRIQMQDPDIVTCKFCKVQMRKNELKDHAIAHTIQQKQVERQHIQRVAEINAFFEQEELETEGERKAPVLTKLELVDMPVTKFEVTERHDDEDVFFKCTVCQSDFEDGEAVRTIRCLHMFHQVCIDTWLTQNAGSCPVCKAIQRPVNLSETEKLERAQVLAQIRDHDNARREQGTGTEPAQQ